MITVTIAGNLGKDAETRLVQDNQITSFSLASTSKVKGDKVTTWVDCSIWGESGVKLAQYLTKGARIVVTGSLATREYEGKTYLQCRVDHLELMGGGQPNQ